MGELVKSLPERHFRNMDVGASVIDGTIDFGLAGARLDRALAVSVPSLSRERLKTLIHSGAISVNGTAQCDPANRVKGRELFTITLPPVRALHNAAQAIALAVVFEDDELIVVDKPAGLVVHPAAGNADGTLVNALLHHCAGRLSGIGGVARPGIVHRIDKDTSGLIVAAKTDRAHEGLSSQFATHSIDRRYLAMIGGRPTATSGTVDAPLARSPYDRKKMTIVDAKSGKRAVTHWRLLTSLRSAALVECKLETGRTHQVRVHLSSIGHPLVGDPVYGRTRSEHRMLLARLGFTRQALHAAGLGFAHPVSNENLSFKSPIPADMQELFTALTV